MDKVLITQEVLEDIKQWGYDDKKSPDENSVVVPHEDEPINLKEIFVKLKVTNTRGGAVDCKLTDMDGNPIRGVTKVVYTAEAKNGCVGELVLTVWPQAVEIEGSGKIEYDSK